MKTALLSICMLVIFGAIPSHAKRSSYDVTCHNVETGPDDYISITITKDLKDTGRRYATVVQGSGNETFQRIWVVGKNQYRTTANDTPTIILYGEYGPGPSTFYLEVDMTKVSADEKYPAKLRLVNEGTIFEEEVECHMYN